MVEKWALYTRVLGYLLKQASDNCVRKCDDEARKVHHTARLSQLNAHRDNVGEFNRCRDTSTCFCIWLGFFSYIWIIIFAFTVAGFGCDGILNCIALETHIWALTILWFLCMISVGFLLQTFIFFITYYNGRDGINILYPLAVIFMICHCISVFFSLEAIQITAMKDFKYRCNNQITEMHSVFCDPPQTSSGNEHGVERLRLVDIYLHGKDGIKWHNYNDLDCQKLCNQPYSDAYDGDIIYYKNMICHWPEYLDDQFRIFNEFAIYNDISQEYFGQWCDKISRDICSMIGNRRSITILTTFRSCLFAVGLYVVVKLMQRHYLSCLPRFKSIIDRWKQQRLLRYQLNPDLSDIVIKHIGTELQSPGSKV